MKKLRAFLGCDMKFVKIGYHGHIASLTLNRPEVRNAFNPEMIEELKQAIGEINEQKQIRVIHLKGEGKAFCAGGDLHWMQDMVNFSYDENQRDSQKLFALFEQLMNCPLPIIATVHGAAFGGGIGLVACCDYVICEEKTQFCFSEVKLGIVPAVISAFVLKKCSLGQIGPAMIAGNVFNAQQAKQMSLIHEVGDEDSVQDHLVTALNWFKETGPLATKETKKLIHSLGQMDWQQIKNLTCQTIAAHRTNAEGQEGLKSFLEKRKPSWRVM
jgi:methylglutaconyl-CoA hydratase